MVSRKAIIETLTGLVQNVIIAEDTFSVPAGFELIDALNASPGDTWDGAAFIRPAPTPPSARDVRLGELQDALTTDTASLPEVREFLRLAFRL